jgi:hypothetical protein
MTYATVMVGLSIDQPNEARLEIAGQPAERFGARVIGITAAEFSPPPYFTSGEQAQKLLDQGHATIKTRAVVLERQFRAAIQNRGAEVEWRCAEDFPSRYIVEQARASDIIVVGEAGHGAIPDPFVQVNPSDLVLQAGRPLLVVPGARNWLDIRSVLIAWKIRRRRGGPSPMRCRCFAELLISPSSRLSRNRPIGRRRCPGSRMSRHGCCDTGQVHPNRCPRNTAKPARNWRGSHRKLALASSSRALTGIHGFANGSSAG